MWYVLWTTTGKEENVKKEIEKRISEDVLQRCFVPYRKERRKQDGRWTSVKKVLFPGYLFVETDDIEDLFFEIKHMVQFSLLLKSDEVFCPISQKEEMLLKQLMGTDDTVDVSVGIIENEEVIITEGPLQGLEGFITRIDRHKRKAYLKINFFNRIMDVSVGLEIVEKK